VFLLTVKLRYACRTQPALHEIRSAKGRPPGENAVRHVIGWRGKSL